MIAFLISDHAIWCAKMMNGDKTIEVRKGTAIHISNLEIFDKPKELSEFYHYVKYNKEMARLNNQDWDFVNLSKAPQSWCYIEGE